MKKVFSLLLVLTITSISHAQNVKFSIKQITDLFGKSTTTVSNFLDSNNYSLIEKELPFYVYERWTNIGAFKVTVAYKNGKLNLFSFETTLSNRNSIIEDLNATGYSLVSKYHFGESIFTDFMLTYKNQNSNRQCTLINSTLNGGDGRILKVSIGSEK